MEYSPKKKPTEAQKEKRRAYYREHSDEILNYQHSTEYVENRRAQRRASDKYRNYHKFDKQERRKDPGFRAKSAEAVRESHKRHIERYTEYNKQYNSEHRAERAAYMREYRAKKKAEKSKMDGSN